MTQTALLTGASAGFGLAIAEVLCGAGFVVLGAARRMNRLEEIRERLGQNFHPLELDVTSKDSIERAAQYVQDHFPDGLDVLINNAGLALGTSPAHQADIQDWDRMMQTNAVGLAHMVHRFLPDMVRRNHGHIINIGSIAGNYAYPGGNIYCATKAFVKRLTEGLRADVHGTRLRVTNIEPGLVGGTEFSLVRMHGDQDRAAGVYADTEPLQPEDVAEAVIWVIRQPARVNINSIEMMPVVQSLAGTRVFRQP